MKKYFLNDGTGQQGPFTLEELKEKNIRTDTAVWYDGLPEWTTAGALDELKDVIMHTPPPFHAPPPVAEVKPTASVVETPAAVTNTAEKSTTVMAASSSSARSPKKKTAWLSWVLFLLVIGGVGYFIYQQESDTGNKAVVAGEMNSESENTGDVSDDKPESSSTTTGQQDVAANEETSATNETTTTAATNQPPAANTSKTSPATLVNDKAKSNVTPTKAQQAEAQKLALKKAEDDKKKQQAAIAAAAAKEKEYRNNWAKYVTLGDYRSGIVKNDDGVEAFNIPVYNRTNATLDKVTLQVDYWKKDKKVKKSETVVIYAIPPGGGLNGRAPESKKGNNIEVKITGITSRKLHFCYPNNGSSDDPYFCN